ncbi:MAG: SUMF1/EgtB/PvdO family nonheme iron enzyme [Myxococcales bacterium]|nr:SUMF1/EgtB/PvdO family nonheme iron enzyme [Myxococcales bacterium]
MSEDPPLADLDEFRLLRALGRGGMGAVYLARDTLLDRLVAVKVIGVGAAGSEGRRRFLTEARAIARLNHPNVVGVYRAGVTADGQPYLAQELVRGQSLDRLELPVPPGRATEIALGVARGLAAAHRRGILHRDVKLANVMLDEAGVPRLLDFGLAKLGAYAEAAPAPPPSPLPPPESVATLEPVPSPAATLDPIPSPAGVAMDETPPRGDAPPTVDADRVDAAATADGALLGTPRYLAPELWRGHPASIASDLYAFGVLLFELLAGHPPFGQRTLADLRSAVLVADPAPLAVDGLAPELAALVADCMQREAAARPASADQVVHRIERLLAGAPALAAVEPYPGLEPFDDARRADFFGRGAEIAAMVDRLRGESLLAITGDSGTGKSSLARAGVLPAVVRGALGDGRRWEVRAVRLARAPAAALTSACGLAPGLIDDPSPTAIAAGLADRGDRGLLVFVDQLEELITEASAEEQGAALRLLAALAGDVPGVKVVATLRGDFFTRLASTAAFGPLLVRGLAVLGPLAADGVREAAVGPARARGVRFESETTVAALVEAARTAPGALPLVQFALAELWSRRDQARGLIPTATLDELGGVAGALARHGDRVLAALGPTTRPAARRIALALVTRAGTRATRTRDELAGDDPDAGAALEALVAGRLVVGSDGGGPAPVYQLAHDALIAAWSTLRGWLDDAAGQRGRRARLAAAADEWHRLGRRPQHLWSAAQLADAAGLDELSDRDRQFVTASRRANVRRRAALVAAIAALPLIAGGTWSWIRRGDARDRAARVALRAAQADAHERDAREAAAQAAAGRAALATWFAAGTPAAAEERWRNTQADAARARRAFTAAANELEAALIVAGESEPLRRRLATLLVEHAALLEAEFDAVGADALIARAALYDRAQGDRWHAPSRVTVTARGATSISAARYVDQGGRLVLDAPVASVAGARATLTLAPGSYRLALATADGVVVMMPVAVARGEASTVALALPRAAELPAGFVYVPPGHFLAGSRDPDSFRTMLLEAAPQHRRRTAGFLIARDETTYGDWIEFLRALPPAERERRRPRTLSDAARSLRLEGAGPFTLRFQPVDAPMIAAEGAPLWFATRPARQAVAWERAPVGGIDFDDALAYAAWLRDSGRVPRARLCEEYEWERAARGADGRRFPHGDRMSPDDANVDVTYDRQPDRFGPDEVGAHPNSESPFGVRDLAGNVKEWTVASDGGPRLRGGDYYHSTDAALAMNRDPAEPTMRLPWIGVRICADPQPGLEPTTLEP